MTTYKEVVYQDIHEAKNASAHARHSAMGPLPVEPKVERRRRGGGVYGWWRPPSVVHCC